MSAEGKKVHVLHNGCPRRALDLGKIASYFRLNGCELTDRPEEADHIVFVTCAFIARKEKECYDIIAELAACRGRLIVAGCLPGISKEKLSRVFAGPTVTTKDIGGIEALFPDFTVRFSDLDDINIVDQKLYAGRGEGASVSRPPAKEKETPPPSLRISTGCRGSCAYCMIRGAIGPLRSKPIADCVKEYRELLGQGFSSFALLADDAGAYGLDIGSSFSELLEALDAASPGPGPVWRLHHIHPEWLVKYEAAIVPRVKSGRIIRILSAVQSGSDRLLARMNRYSDTATLRRVMKACRAANPDFRIYTNIIIGFPGETDEDFLSTLEFVKDIGFRHILMFSYYDHEKALSYRMPEKVDAAVIETRLALAKKVLSEAGIEWLHDDNHVVV